MKELFVIVFKDSKAPVTTDNIKKYWPNYGTNELYGWRPPKKVYFKLHHAKAGFSHLPADLQPYLEICKYGYIETVIDGEILGIEQNYNSSKKACEGAKRFLEWAKKRTDGGNADGAIERYDQAKEEFEKWQKLKDNLKL